MPSIQIADKPTLDQVKALIGAVGDPAGVNTLYAYQALLAAYVDELESRLTAARAAYLDAAISSRAAAVDWTAARAGKLDLIGSTGDAAGQNTIFAYFKRLEAFVDELETRSIIKSIQRGAAASAGAVTINAVNTSKTMVLSFSQGSAGSVAATGSISLSPSGGTPIGFTGGGTELGTGSFPTYSGSITGGTTDLTVKEYGAYLQDATHIYCTGACRWEVIEFV